MFETELAFFKSCQNDLVKKYSGKVLVIRGETVESVHDTPLQAYLEAQKRFPLGTFMLQPCVPGPGAYSVNIVTRGLMG